MARQLVPLPSPVVRLHMLAQCQQHLESAMTPPTPGQPLDLDQLTVRRLYREMQMRSIALFFALGHYDRCVTDLATVQSWPPVALFRSL